MKKRLPWSTTLMVFTLIFARSGSAQDFTNDLKSLPLKPGRRSMVLHASKAFHVTAKYFLDNEDVPLYRAACGILFIGVDQHALVSPQGQTARRRRGAMRYLPARGVGGGYRVRSSPDAKFFSSLQIALCPVATENTQSPIPAAELRAALKEQDLQTLQKPSFPSLPRSRLNMPVVSVKILDVPGAEVNHVTIARTATLSKLARSSIWFVLKGRGNLRVGRKAYPLQPNSLLALPPGTGTITVAPSAGKSGSVPERMRIILVQHKML